MEPTAGTGGTKQIIKQGHTSGRYGSQPNAKVKGDNSSSDLSIKTKSA